MTSVAEPAHRDRLPDVEGHPTDGVDQAPEAGQVHHRPVVDVEPGDPLDRGDRPVHAGVLDPLEQRGVVTDPRRDAVQLAVGVAAVVAVRPRLAHHRSLREREVRHVARQPDQHGLAGGGVDAGDGHRVGPQTPPAGAGVAAHQQHVVAPVVLPGHRVAGEHGQDEVALHADQVRAEQQRPGDRQAEDAVQPDHGAPVGKRQRQRLADPPGVEEQGGPADGEHHQGQAQVRPAPWCPRRTRRRTGGARAASTSADERQRHERRPDPGGDTAHPAVSRRPAAPSPARPGSSPSASGRGGNAHARRGRRRWPDVTGSSNPGEEAGSPMDVSLCARGSSPASITSHSGHSPARRAEAEGLGRPR